MATAATTANAARTRVFDALPDFLRTLPEDQRELARRHALARVEDLAPGLWQPAGDMFGQHGNLGVLILEGLMMRDVVLASTTATEIVGRGDILRPGDHDGDSAPVPFAVEWRVLQPTQVALLDRNFTTAVGRWPELVDAFVLRAVRRAHSLGLHLAVCHLRRVEVRLLVLMWHMADRWGKVGPDGVRIPLKLTHQMLGHLIGAQRPSVTTSLKQLAQDGLVTRCADGTWMLHGDPPDTLEQIRATADERGGEATAVAGDR